MSVAKLRKLEDIADAEERAEAVADLFDTTFLTTLDGIEQPAEDYLGCLIACRDKIHERAQAIQNDITAKRKDAALQARNQ